VFCCPWEIMKRLLVRALKWADHVTKKSYPEEMKEKER
jgi:hypothetical protein